MSRIDFVLGVSLFNNGTRLTTPNVRHYWHADTRPNYGPIPFQIQMPPAHPMPASTLLRAVLTPRGELDAGWLMLDTAIEIEYGYAGPRPGRLYVAEPTADPSCLVHFPSPLPDVFPGIISLALRRAQ